MSELHSEASGSGPPMVFWHGWGMNLRVFDDMRAALATEYRTRAVDLPGHGASAWRAGLDGEAQLDLLATALPENSVLVGWSLGAQFALRAAARWPQRVRALVLLHATPRFAASVDWVHGTAAPVLQEFSARLEGDYRQTVSDFLELQVRGSAVAPAVRRALRDALLLHGSASPEALRLGLQLLIDTDLRELARTLHVPALVIAGQHDRVSLPGASRALAHSLPRAQFLEIQRAGHASFLSHPAEVLGAMRAFLGAA